MAARFGETVFARLSAAAGVTALVGTSPARIYPNVLRQGSTMPAVVYQVIVDQPTNSVDGYSSALRRARVQVDCYSRTYDGAQALGDAVNAVLGSYGSATLASIQISRRDLYEDNEELHRASLDFSLWAKE